MNCFATTTALVSQRKLFLRCPVISVNLLSVTWLLLACNVLAVKSRSGPAFDRLHYVWRIFISSARVAEGIGATRSGCERNGGCNIFVIEFIIIN